MSAQSVVLVTLAAAFGVGAIAILAARIHPSTCGIVADLWELYRSEFLIVGALLVPAALGPRIFFAAILIFLARAGIELFRLFKRQMAPLAVTAILVALCAGGAVALRTPSDGFLWVFLVYATVEIGDAFALLCGKLFGRTRILPRLSPRKTAEGLVGGLLLGGVAGVLLGIYLLGLSPARSAGLAFLILAAGLAGDLLTSALKRAHGAKDFSPVLARHGGALDIYDSFLVAAPAAYLFRLLVF